MVAQGVEVIPHDRQRERILVSFPLHLQVETLLQVARAHSRGVQRLHDPQHRLHFVGRVWGEDAGQFGQLLFPVLLVLDLSGPGKRGVAQPLGGAIEAVSDILERAREEPVVVDVTDDLSGDPGLAVVEVEESELLVEVVLQVPHAHDRRFELLARLVLLPWAPGVESVQQDLVPVDLVVLFVAGVLFGIDLEFVVGVGLGELEEGILRQLLLKAGLKVQQRHVQQIHRLVKARIDPQLLPKVGPLVQARPHPVHAKLNSRDAGTSISCGPSARAPDKDRQLRRSRRVATPFRAPGYVLRT